jgi:acyl-CoA dehydrogenase
VIGTFAWAEGSGAPLIREPVTRVSGGRIQGTKLPVPDAAIAKLCVTLAATEDGPAFALVELDQEGVERTPLTGFDELRHHSAIRFDNAVCEVLDGAAGPDIVRAIFDRAAVIESFEQLGGTESAMYMARDYTLERYIFGRQLASYQAVKHNLADTLVTAELARSNAMYAVGAVDEGQKDQRAAAANARIGATRAYERAARENLQLHGGIGFTWEANCHFHYRRARLLALNIGSVEAWTDWLIDALSEQAEAA